MDWLLLRGLAREQRHWHDFRDRFTARAGEGRVYLLDVAGVGTEHGRRPRPSVQWLANDVARRLPALSAPEGASLSVLGLSLGGMIALELCRAFPRHIQRAVIVNASSRLTSARARLRPPAALELVRAALGRDPVERERRVLRLTSTLPEAERSRYAEIAAEFEREAPPSGSSALVQLLAAARFLPPPRHELRAELLFVSARNDVLVSPRCTRDLAAWYGAPSDEHPSAGHDLPLDDPQWLCQRIFQFVHLRGAQVSADAAGHREGDVSDTTGVDDVPL